MQSLRRERYRHDRHKCPPGTNVNLHSNTDTYLKVLSLCEAKQFQKTEEELDLGVSFSQLHGYTVWRSGSDGREAMHTWKGMPSSSSMRPTSSLFSTLVVPTSTGRPFLCMRTISVTTDCGSATMTNVGSQ
jgi:hypothetical protein